MMELMNFQELLKVGALSSIAVYGVTEAIKPLIKRFTGPLSRTLIRVFALGCGTFFGWFLGDSPEFIISGFCGAALSALVVARVKEKIKGQSE